MMPIAGRHPLDAPILRLAGPALGALVAEPAYVLTDTAIVARLGTPQLGGLAVATAILLSAHALMIFLAYGTTGSVARRLGAGDDAGAAGEAVQGCWLAVGAGVVLAVAGAFTAGPLVRFFGASGEVEGFALTYLRISLIGLPALLLVLAGTGYLRGLQDTRTPLVVALGTAAGNLVLELVLVFVLDLGVAGSAWSTVAAQFAAAAIYVAVVGRSARRLGISLAPDRAGLRSGAGAGVALMVRTAALRGAFVVATAVAARIGVVSLAAHEIAFQVWSFLALALDALAIAGQAMIGRDLGAGSADRARATTSRLLQLAVQAGVVFTVGVALLAPVLPGLFTADDRVAELTRFLLWWVAGMQLVNAVVFVLDGVLIGAGDLRYLAAAMTGCGALFVALAVGVRLADLGVGWLWAALTVFLTARAITLLARARGDSWLVEGAVRQPAPGGN